VLSVMSRTLKAIRSRSMRSGWSLNVTAECAAARARCAGLRGDLGPMSGCSSRAGMDSEPGRRIVTSGVTANSGSEQ
jgi:hypothetical protein